MNLVARLDDAVFTLLNRGWQHPAADHLMAWLSSIGDPWCVTILLLAAGFGLGWRMPGGRSRARAVTLASLYLLAFYGSNAAVYNAIKLLASRERPYLHLDAIVRVTPEVQAGLRGEGSFPSGHAANAFMLALLARRLLRAPFVSSYLLASLVAFSRVYLGVHHPGDVVAGAVLAWGLTWLLLRLWPPPWPGHVRRGLE